MIKAEIICDSVANEKRITTYKLRYPKFIHGEFMTHRTISRNASSSRAIPTAKLIEEVRSDDLRAAPIFWGKNQPGMQALKELEDFELEMTKEGWKLAAHQAAATAVVMLKHGAHKQIVNRVLEPFSHINVVATATEWDNFFGLRLHADAQPEMRALAVAMWEARGSSRPRPLSPGMWHLPFATWADTHHEDEEPARAYAEASGMELMEVLRRTSVARCARVSYESFETGRRSGIEEDLRLFDRLLGSQPLHASPAEHQATPDDWDKGGLEIVDIEAGAYHNNQAHWKHAEQHGNLVGWRQYRKMLAGEACAPLPEEYKI